jgi:hypothetical protein
MGGTVMGQLEDAVTAERERYLYSFGRSDEWYVVLPAWFVYAGGRTVEQYAEKFEQDLLKMAGLPLGNLVGFEVDTPGGGVYRYRTTYYDGGSPVAPDEEIPA